MPLLLSRRRVEAGEWTFDATVDAVGVANMAIPAGDYYLDSSTASESLVSQMDTLLEANFAGEDFTVTFSTTTGKITWTCTTLATTWSVTFDQASFAEWVGFSGAGGGWGLVAGASQTSTNPCQGAISTSSGRSDFPGRQHETTVPNVRPTLAGQVQRISAGDDLQFSEWRHEFERLNYQASPWESGTWDDASANLPWAWYDAWRHHNVLQPHQPFRYYTALGQAITAYEDAYVWTADKYQPRRVIVGSDRYWSVPLDVRRWVA